MADSEAPRGRGEEKPVRPDKTHLCRKIAAVAGAVSPSDWLWVAHAYQYNWLTETGMDS